MMEKETIRFKRTPSGSRMVVDNDLLVEQMLPLIEAGQKVTIPVRGSSMYPFLYDGRDQVVLRRPQNNELRRGATVFFRYYDRYMIHRIVRVRERELWIRGDNRRVGGYEKVPPEAVVAIAESVKRNGRVISCFSAGWIFLSNLWMLSFRFRLTIYPFLRKTRDLRKNLEHN